MTTRSLSQISVGANYDSDAPSISTFEYVSFAKQASGGNTLGYKKIRRRNLPVNSYSMSGFRLYPVNRFTRITDKDPALPSYRHTRTLVGTVYLIPSLASPTLVQQLDSSLSSKALGKIKSSDINLAQSFGERHQTVSMLANTASRLTRAYRSLRRGNLYSACRDLTTSTFELDKRRPGASRRFSTTYPKNPQQAAANAWLELQYGWRPLLNDVYGAAKVLAEQHVRSESDVYTGVETIKVSRSLNETSLIGGKFFSEASVGGKYAITYDVTNPLLRYSAMLGITNPALLAWELTPFSFVVDWFLPIGNYLSNIDACYGIEFRSGCKSLKFSSTSVGYDSVVTNEPYREFESYCQIGPNQAFKLTRVPIYQFPSNPLPSFKNPLSVSNAISAISLLVQVFKR